MKLQKPNINLTNANYHKQYMVMFDLVRFSTTKEVTDHIMFQREIIESQRATIAGGINNKIVASYKWINVKEKLPEKKHLCIDGSK